MNPKTVQYLSLNRKGTCCMRCVGHPCQEGPMLTLEHIWPCNIHCRSHSTKCQLRCPIICWALHVSNYKHPFAACTEIERPTLKTSFQEENARGTKATGRVECLTVPGMSRLHR